MKWFVVVFPPIITLERFDIRVELGLDMIEKFLKFCKDVGFLFKRKDP